MSDERSYGERFLENLKGQCEARGIPLDEFQAVCDHVAGKYGEEAITSLHGGQLKNAQQNVDAHMRSYLGGAKRRGGDGGAWPADVGGVVEAAVGMNIEASPDE